MPPDLKEFGGPISDARVSRGFRLLAEQMLGAPWAVSGGGLVCMQKTAKNCKKLEIGFIVSPGGTGWNNLECVDNERFRWIEGGDKRRFFDVCDGLSAALDKFEGRRPKFENSYS